MNWFERTLHASGFPIKKAEQDYLRLNDLSAEELMKWTEHQRRLIVEHHLEHSTFYLELVQQHLGQADLDSLLAEEIDDKEFPVLMRVYPNTVNGCLDKSRIVKGGHNDRYKRTLHKLVGFLFAA